LKRAALVLIKGGIRTVSRIVDRRNFLMTAACGAAAAPVAASFNGLGWAQTKPDETHATAAKSAAAVHAGPTVTLNVKDYGAAGDGKTKDTLALQLTIERCSVLGGGEVVVPAGDYTTGALELRSNVTLRIDDGASLLGSGDMADYPIAQVRWEGRWIKGYSAFISATDAENIGITGPGKIVANPAIMGRVERKTGMRLPALLEFTNCRNVRVENCLTSQSGMWSTHPVYCENVTFKNVVIHSGADGIDVDSCRHVTIDGCTFETSDDCISLKSGRGEEANTINRPCEDVHILNCTFSDKNFACIGIGSETSAGVRNVVVEHCKCVGARSHAIYIKSRPGRGAFVENITVNDFEASGAKQGFLRLNNLNSGKQDEFPVPGDAGIPLFREFHFSNIRVADVPALVQATEIHPRKPLVGFSLVNVTGTCKSGITLANMKNVVIRNVKVTGFDGPLLSISDVTGSGLAGAAAIDPAKMPKVPDAVPEPEKPYALK
jgi:polygalacturonase